MAADLEQLGPTGFQDLAGALAIAIFGPGVQAMGSGRDGGRDLYHDGPLGWAPDASQPGETWNGYTVLQVKHKERLESEPAANARWLQGQIRTELGKWADGRPGRESPPDGIIFITNVYLTPVPGVGGHDQTVQAIKDYIASFADNTRDIGDGNTRRAKYDRLSRIHNWRIWDANQIQAMLAVHQGVRRAFPNLTTVADIYAQIPEITGYLPKEQLDFGLRSHARTTLVGDNMIYFDEAGSGDGTGIPLHDVVIDLPATPPGRTEPASAISYILDRGERMLRPSLTTVSGPRHIVVAGAPGNGKTTISRFLVQAFRAASLEKSRDLSVDHHQVVRGTANALQRVGRSLPLHRRWAMRIDLAEYAEEHGQEEDSTLIGYIAEKVTKRSDRGKIQAASLVWWQRQWPWFLVLDGLDEVTDPKVRKRLIRSVTELVADAEAENCDLFVVLTTRPMGYVENIAPNQFERVDMGQLAPSEAVRYGELATRVWLRNDLDRIDKVVRQLRIAAEDEALRPLLRTPLQVLIMTIILGNAGHFSPDRYSLFWGYYEVVFKREREKIASVRRILQEHAQQILRLHERVGFELQARSEAGEHSYAILAAKELRDITWHVLREAGFQPSGTDSELLFKILAAATQRLVLIAPRGDDGYGFDVRSLQELMASRYLTTGPLDSVIERLSIAAPSPHWRNTIIFSAGRIFADPQDHQHQAVVELIENVDANADTRLGSIVPIGPRLALDVIDDGMTRSLPLWRDRIMRHGLRILREPCPDDPMNIAKTLVRFADTGEEQHKIIASGLRDALSASANERETAARIQDRISLVADEIKANRWVRGMENIKPHPGVTPPPALNDGWEDFDAEVETSPATPNTLDRVRAATAALHRLGDHDVDEVDVETIKHALANRSCAGILMSALQHVAAQEPALVASLRVDVLPAVFRAAVGHLLRHHGGDSPSTSTAD